MSHSESRQLYENLLDRLLEDRAEAEKAAVDAASFRDREALFGLEQDIDALTKQIEQLQNLLQDMDEEEEASEEE